MLQLLSISGAEPVTVDEAKLAARVDGAELDDYIAGAITAAREGAEQLTGRAYRAKVLRAELRAWPAADEALPVFSPSACVVRTWNGSGWDTLSASAYEYAPDCVTGTRTVLAPVLGTSWPTLLQRAVGPSVQIDLTVGPDDASTVSESVKLFIKAQVAAWVGDPEAANTKSRTVSPLLVPLLDGQCLRC